ncbi:MAG: endonuclease/exonuclease/phosphatase family protein [Nannocystaceae bacterium]
MKLRAALARLVVVVAELALVGVAAATVVGLVGGHLLDRWLADLLNHFAGQYLVIAAIAAAIVGAARRRRWLVLGVLVVVVGLVRVAPLYVAATAPAPASGERLRLLHLNVLSSNRAYDEVVAYFARSGADLIFVQEVSDAWADALAAVPGYRLVASVPRRDNFGVAALARDDRPPPAVEVVELTADLPAIALTTQLDGATIAILSVHTVPPASADYARSRDAMLVAAGDWARARRDARDLPVILGDLNTTPFSRSLGLLLRDADLVNSQRGQGLAPTWPTGPWFARALFAIAIDHALHDPKLVTTARAVGPDLGSDHRPLHVELGLGPLAREP